ncbi:hypothetical protein FRB91_001426 [Serendipita sp. 411]|nr:hypothetical protein FRB91_001426 [Serendipita sp. 411]
MADAQWMKTCDLLRRCAGNVGPLGEGRSYVEAGWKGGIVVELPLNLPVQKTQETIGQPSGVSGPQASDNETPTIKPPPNRLPIPGPAVNSASSAVVLSTPSLEGKSRSSHAEMVEQIAEELKNSAAPPKDAKQGLQQTPKEAIQKKPSDQEIPKSRADVKQVAKPPPETISSSQRDAAPTTISSGTTNTDRSDITKSSNATSSKDTDTDAEESEYKPPTKATATSTSLTTPRSGALVNSSELGKADTPPKLPMEKKADDILMPKPLMARSSTNQTLESLESTHPQRFPDIGISSPSSQQISYNPTLTSPTPIFAAHSTTGQSAAPALQPSQPIPPSLYSRKPVGRTMSIDSTGSAGGVVSALRERYTSPPPPAQAMATPRESFTPRDGAGRVSDMASRFTPIEHSADVANFGYGRDGRYPRLTSPSSPPLSRGMGNQTHDSLPIRRPLGPSAIDEFGKPIESGRRGPDPTPNAELRRPPLKSSTMGSSTMNSNAHSEYDIRLSELELQQRELELQRGRLQLAREREALLTRERDAQDSVHDSDYSSGREGASFRGGWGAAVSPPLSHGESYDAGRYGNREGFYDSSLRQGIHADSYDQYRREGYESQGRGTPRGGESITFSPYGEGGRYVDETRAPGSHTPSMADYSSIGQSMMGLGPPPPPPGASLAGMHSRSRENLMGTAGPKSQQLSPPVPKPSSTASRSSREPSPRRSADAVPSSVGKRYNEKEKGGTWLKGLKRLSMPVVPNNGH